ncbi:hypothetical protein [Plantactinospora sp. KBS50]|uniref:hypothetical protein n=1 Tax=Plantactinospora sp. KBS50 TaxID=2024580 RepID=UPI000BAB13EC|nr:hypothetical protein [Plantactinospora sp. KBS50]ASW56078.1 hypothetical protein CIK06_20715 [Plantactinospora sp. KBS50]
MLIDCDTCAVRGRSCDGCLVSALIEAPDGGLTAAEERAIEAFARAGFDVEVLAAPAPVAAPLTGRARRRHVA